MLAHVHRPYKPDTTCNHEQSYYMYYAMHFYNFERVVEWNIVLFRMTVVYGVSKMNNIYGTFVLLLQQRYLYYNTRVSYKGIPTTFGRLFFMQCVYYMKAGTVESSYELRQ